MSAVLVFLPSAGYVAAMITAARWRYRKLRPLKFPGNCTDRSKYHTHYGQCYWSPGGTNAMIDSRNEAVVYSLIQALGWPLYAIGGLLTLAITWRNDKPNIAETRARIAELERTLEINRPVTPRNQITAAITESNRTPYNAGIVTGIFAGLAAYHGVNRK